MALLAVGTAIQVLLLIMFTIAVSLLPLCGMLWYLPIESQTLRETPEPLYAKRLDDSEEAAADAAT